MYFLIVLFHSALTKPIASAAEHPHRKNQEIHVGFDGAIDDVVQHSLAAEENKESLFASGLVQKSLTIGSRGLPAFATVELAEDLKLDTGNDFSVEFWIRTTARNSNRFVVLSKKQIPDNSLASHKPVSYTHLTLPTIYSV